MSSLVQAVRCMDGGVVLAELIVSAWMAVAAVVACLCVTAARADDALFGAQYLALSGAERS
jgi:hypothetical protein